MIVCVVWTECVDPWKLTVPFVLGRRKSLSGAFKGLLERGGVFCVGIHLAPFATGNVEPSFFLNNVIGPTEDRGSGRDVLTSGDERDAILELKE
jgi:hypothetical protein